MWARGPHKENQLPNQTAPVWLRLGWWSFMMLWAVCWLASVHGIATVGPVPKSHYLRGGFMTKLCPNMIFCVSLRSICSSVPSGPANHTYCAYILICHHRCHRYSGSVHEPQLSADWYAPFPNCLFPSHINTFSCWSTRFEWLPHGVTSIAHTPD